MKFYHYKANDAPEFIHLHLTGNHYTPYLPPRENSIEETGQKTLLFSQQGHDNAMADDEAEIAESASERYVPAVAPPRHDKAMTSCLTAEARSSHTLPPWTQGMEGTELFTHFQQLDEHPFAYKENLVYLLTSNIFLENNLPVPKVEDRYRIIKEYHESSIRGHKGITKTYDKLSHEFYWRNMQSDVRQFVRGCPYYQTQKLVRVKTRLPMITQPHKKKKMSKPTDQTIYTLCF